VFFSEEKNQKTLSLRQRTDPGHGRIGGSSGEHKSLLLLFFRKEDSFFLAFLKDTQ
jgi:hypothetical protein